MLSFASLSGNLCSHWNNRTAKALGMKTKKRNSLKAFLEVDSMLFSDFIAVKDVFFISLLKWEILQLFFTVIDKMSISFVLMC